MERLFSLLKSRFFLPLFVTQFFGAFNDNAFKNALLIWLTFDVAEKTGGDASTLVTIAGGLFILPFFLFSATAGQLADKYDQALLARRIKLIEILLMGLCGLFFYLENVYALLGLLFCMGSQSAFFGPIKYSLLPEHLKKSDLIAGNGIINGATFLSILLGTIFGGLIIITALGQQILATVLIGFSIIGWLASRHIPQAKRRNPALIVQWTMIVPTMKIFRLAKQTPLTWKAIVGISWYWVLGATFLTLFPPYTKDVIHGNEHIVTLFLSCFTLGIGAGSLSCQKILQGKISGRLIPYGILGIVLSTCLLIALSFMFQGSVPDFSEQNLPFIGVAAFLSQGIVSWGILAALFLLALCAGIYITPLYALIQHLSTPQHMGRMIATNNILNACFMVLGSLVVLGLLALGIPILYILLTAGLLTTVMYKVLSNLITIKG